MGIKVNNGHSFLHPASGLIIGPGDVYHDGDDEQTVEESLSPSPLSVEEFKALSAQEQKDLLLSMEIEAGSNEPQRIEQYTDWLNAQANAGRTS
ncbi:hypothetical protein [Paenibacillus rigui]|uniref:Uncharacterized protein n=1 Tax=Paenibacillus rigui TaxID=554312 RepID=A0A229UML0_9BACL|nr:hypothetical protein [Paenibacillus rigui]OXM84601.1 hypothetical protein CF651_19025 [Paenibacillus rigui]